MKKLLVIFVITILTHTIYADLNGSGASLPEIYFKQIFTKYHQQTNTTINYNAIGSGKGLSMLMSSGIDFAATDIAPKNSEKNILSVPTVVSGIAIAINLPEISKSIKLTGPILAQIMAGRIKKWNDKQLTTLNPDLSLPNKPIQFIYRKNSSGTNYHLTQFISQTTPRWAAKMGTVDTLKLKKGVPVQSNSEMAQKIKSTPYSMGYLDWNSAIKNNLTAAAIQTNANTYIKPSFKSIYSAAKNATQVEGIFITTNTKGKFSYPITSLTWIAIDTQKSDKLDQLSDLIWWITHEGQLYAEENNFPPLPPKLMEAATKKLAEIEL